MIVHFLDAQDVLGRDDERAAFAIVRNHAPQFRDAIPAHDVYAFRLSRAVVRFNRMLPKSITSMKFSWTWNLVRPALHDVT